MVDDEEDAESLHFSDTSLSEDASQADTSQDSELECTPCIDDSCPQISCDCGAAVESQVDEESVDSLSDVSDNSDIFHVAPCNDITTATLEDEDIDIIDNIKQHLRTYPLLPAKQSDAEGNDSFDNLANGVQLSLLTCGFLNCNWQSSCSMKSHRSLEQHLYLHLKQVHRDGRSDCILCT